MTDLLFYTIKSALVLLLLYPPYVLWMHRDGFFRFNRFVLLGILLLSLLLPLCDVHWLSFSHHPAVQVARMQLIEFGIPVPLSDQSEIQSASSGHFSIFGTLALVYVGGMLLCFFFFLFCLYRLQQCISKDCLWTQQEGAVQVYCHAESVSPFSWMHQVVISADDYANSAHEILLHERGHAHYGHSWDILFLMTVQVCQWWNPLVYMLGSSLRDVHEYEADDYVLRNGVSAKAYQLLLIKKTVGSGSYTFANSFNHSLTKKRITMMRKTKSNPWMKSKVLYIIPVATLALSAFATPVAVSVPVTEQPVSLGKVTTKLSDVQGPVTKKVLDAQKTVSPQKQEKTVRPDLEKVYPGGLQALMTFLRTQMKYPEACESAGFQGRVLVKFVVGKDGKIVSATGTLISQTSESKKDGGEKKQLEQLLVNEAERVVMAMPVFKPFTDEEGNPVQMEFTLPVNYRLSK